MAGRLVGERDNGREHRRRLAGTAGRGPAAIPAAVGLENVHRDAARGAHRDVRDAALVTGDAPDAVLIAGPAVVSGLPAAGGERVRAVVAEEKVVHRVAVCIVPGRVETVARAAGIQVEPGAADGRHERAGGGPARDRGVGIVTRLILTGRTAVAGGGDDRDVAARGLAEDRAVRADEFPPESLLRLPPAQADHVAEPVLHRVPDAERELLQVLLGHLYQHDLRVRRASVCVLHVQRGLAGPADHVAVAGV